MLSAIKEMLVHPKDYSGHDVDTVISQLAAQTSTEPYIWSYIEEQSVYENTSNGMRVYPHELRRYIY
ncbi:hypothetical protein OTK59_20395 [Vibrio natriegens]|jgi:hypothetical protein|uniref:hypothetical protein n=1 Tax=Vibrio TaxID=662 RepID=UPI000243BB55|nr:MULTISPECIES: hypothetical protein [Vibrio]CAH0532015.1 hypothetical protein CTH30272_04284 [Catenococcus thiocycli]AEX22151.1 hypothetical protein VEJY3_08315 [Vibrio sp. EJY3]AXT71044.1 hypothetical protein DBX26_08310 [Vibrio sp. dhg]MCY9878923.1 hypothetical protein [Vibrio natriegens]BDR13743.1 hypothetical protein VspSTUT11_17190 [Vibrio sp. STUT-A11]